VSGATRTDDDPLLGESIGGYQITALIGEGGMGRVYRAVLPSINAQVAIKVLSVEVASEPDIAERFVAEAKIANLVRHDGLVNVIGIGVVPDGRPYQIMELLQGATLAELIRARGRLPLGTTCVVLCEALRAVAALHAGGVIHRDVKSSNLFVTTAGHVKVIDFGIAKLVSGRGLTQTGQTLGTPEYMAPEQLEGTQIDERVDLYAMGVVLFEAATGERPFKGRVLEALAARSTPPLSGGPTGLDEVIAMAMAPDPNLRYADALAMERALDDFAHTLPDDAFGPLAEGPPLPRPTSLPTRDEAVRRNPKTDRSGDPDPVRDAETRPSVQQMLGRYEVHGVLGKGAAGTVMAGFDPLIQRKVALKVLHPNKSHRDRLIREAQAMAKVSDPNIVTLYELGDDGSRLFLAMELVDGVDLATWLHERRPWQEVVRVFVAAGRGLVAAHAGGVVHRDFKPANVLIGRDGRPRVGDFGLALGQGGGTPAYMAPEQVDGHADERSDQFAFCASLWEGVHGELPFAGETALSLAMSARAGAIRVPMQETPIDDLLRRGLSAKSRERFDSMTELLALLERAIAPRPKRWPWLAAAVALTTATATVALFATRHGDQPPDLGLLREARIAHDPGSVLRALGRVPDDVLDTPEARQLAADAAAAGPTRDIAATSTITGIEVSPDGHRAAIGSRDQIAIYDLTVTAPPVVLGVVGSPSQLEFEAGAMIARIDDAVVKVPLDGTAPTTLARCGQDDAFVMSGSQMITSSDMHFLACSHLAGSIVTDTRTGHSIHTDDFVFDFGHGSERLLVVHEDLVSVIDAKTGAVIGTHPVGKALIATHDDLVVMTEDRNVTVWNPIEPSEHTFTAARDVKFVLVARGPNAQIVVASADGKADLYSASGEHRGHLDLGGPLTGADVPFDTHRNRFLFLTQGSISIADFDADRHLALPTQAKGFAISNDGSTILLAQGTTATVWFPDLRGPTHVTMPVEALIAHTINREGSLAAYADTDRVRIVDLVTGKREESPMPSSASAVGFAADGALGFADSMHRLWSWRIGDRASLFGVYPDTVRWMSLVDDTHAAVMDHDQHIHIVGGGQPGEPCSGTKALAVYGAFAVVDTGSATAACDLRSGATHPLTSTRVTRAALSSDGDRALVIDNGRPRLFRLIDGIEEPLPPIADVVDITLDKIGQRGLVIDKSGDGFVIERGAARSIPLADCHLPTSPSISADGARVAAVVDGHVRMWFVARPDQPHDLGQLGPLPPTAISVALGPDVVLTTSAGLQIDTGISFVLNQWPAALPTVEQVRAWIRAVGG
jgi:serine/threonine protein kinase